MTEWSVLLETAAPPDVEADLDRIGDQAAGLLDLLADHSGAVSAGATSWSARVTVEADDARTAGDRAQRVILKCAAKAGLPDWQVVKLEATRWDVFEAELAEPQLPDLVGTQEITEILGVTRQRLHELRRTGRFPQPMINLAAGPVWVRPAIASFLQTWDRKPGRKKENVAVFAPAGGDAWVVTVPGKPGAFHFPGRQPPSAETAGVMCDWLRDRVRDLDKVEFIPGDSSIEV